MVFQDFLSFLVFLETSEVVGAGAPSSVVDMDAFVQVERKSRMDAFVQVERRSRNECVFYGITLPGSYLQHQ